MPRFLKSLCPIFLLSPALCLAQNHNPIVRQEPVVSVTTPATVAPQTAAPQTTTPTAATPTRTVVQRPRREQVGDVTRTLMAAQASGVRAGAELPVLGATADLTWKRYLDSFNHPIPDWFTEKVESNNE